MTFRLDRLMVLSMFFLTNAVSAQDIQSPPIDLLAARDNLPKINSPKDWQSRKAHILQQMQKVMGTFPTPDNSVPLDMEVLERRRLPFAHRWKVRYHTDDPQAWVHAWLFVPLQQQQARPAVLCLHQTTRIGKDEPAGLGGKENLHYAYELAERGFVTLAPDYPSFGDALDYDFEEDPYISGTMKAIYDNVRAIDLLQSLPMVEAERIGCIGHSLGGHNTMFTAAFEPRIKAMVSCCGFTRFHKYYGGQLKGWTSSRYMPRIASIYDNDPDRVPFDFPEIIGTFAPRPFLAVAPQRDSNFEVSGVRDAISAARPVYELFDASENLEAIYPDCAHDFPPEARETAYQFLEKALLAQ